VEVLGVVGYGPGACVYFGLCVTRLAVFSMPVGKIICSYPSRNVYPIDYGTRRDSWESLRAGRVYAETFADDCLHVWKLLGRRRVDLVVAIIAASNFVA